MKDVHSQLAQQLEVKFGQHCHLVNGAGNRQICLLAKFLGTFGQMNRDIVHVDGDLTTLNPYPCRG
jgi:hypothetical protein